MDYKLLIVDQDGLPLRLREASTRIFEVTLDLSQPVSGGIVPIGSLQVIHAFTIKSLTAGVVLQMSVGEGSGSITVTAGQTRDNLNINTLGYSTDGAAGAKAVLEIQGR